MNKQDKEFINKPYIRKRLVIKLEEERLEKVKWFKKLIDLTYQDGINAKSKIRIELQKEMAKYDTHKE